MVQLFPLSTKREMNVMRNTCLLRTLVVLAALVSAHSASAQTAAPPVEYKVLATNKTSTMQKEMKEAGDAGYRFGGVMGGETSFGGSEVVVVMVKGAKAGRFDYRLLATNKTSTMQKELQEAGDAGYEYRGQTRSRRRRSGTNTAWSRRRRRRRSRRRWRMPVSRDSVSSA
jgi:hypothetical protein